MVYHVIGLLLHLEEIVSINKQAIEKATWREFYHEIDSIDKIHVMPEGCFACLHVLLLKCFDHLVPDRMMYPLSIVFSSSSQFVNPLITKLSC